jgi:hypothetical protein
MSKNIIPYPIGARHFRVFLPFFIAHAEKKWTNGISPPPSQKNNKQ